MESLMQHIEFVNAQIAHYDKMAINARRDPSRLELYKSIAQKLRDLLLYLEELPTIQCGNDETVHGTTPLDLSGFLAKLPVGFLDNPHSLNATDIAGLPEDVINELNITPSDKLEALIVDLVRAAGGSLILDKIIAGLAFITGEKHQRTALTSKLYRMSKKGLIFSVKGKKGLYTINKTSETESVQDELL